MQTFKATTKSRKDFFLYCLKEFAVSLAILSLATFLFSRLIPDFSNYHSIVGVLLLSLVSLFRRDQVNEVIVDRDSQLITVKFTRTFVDEEVFRFNFNELEVKEISRSWYRRHSLTLRKQWGPGFEINTAKDNFSTETISELFHMLQVNLNACSTKES